MDAEMAIHRIAASQIAWLNNYDGTARLVLKIDTKLLDKIVIEKDDHVYITVSIMQGRLSLKELTAFVSMNESKKKP
jgi:hypothetical protein